MLLKFASVLVKFPMLPIVYAISGPFIGTYRGLRGENTPLNYGRLASNYPTEGYVAKDWRDWLYGGGDDNDMPSFLGAMASTGLATVTSSPNWLLGRTLRGIGKGIFGLRHPATYFYKGPKAVLYDVPLETFRGMRRIV